MISRNIERVVNKPHRIETPSTIQTFVLSTSNVYTKRSPIKTSQNFIYRSPIICYLARPAVSFTYISPELSTAVKKGPQQG